jgi:hypothetical protein
VERYEVTHPVLDDPELVTWQAYTARAWPTLVLVDPEGYVVAQYAGEGHVHAIDALVAELREEHLGKGTLQPGDSPYVAPVPQPRDLRFPAKVVALRGQGFLVADTVNHALRGVCVETGTVRTLAGSGRQRMQGEGTASLSSPWDVVWWQGRVWVAMAGIHQLCVVDSETSSLRYLEAGEIHTAVGTGLFDFGFRDGPSGQALLQHPLGVTVLPDGSVAVCDTYNGAVRRYDPDTGQVSTMATDLAEPSGAVVDGAHLVVVESAAHRLTRVPLGSSATPDGFAHTTRRPVTEVVEGDLELVVSFEPPPG